MNSLVKIVDNIVDGMSGGFCNVSCQNGVKIMCQTAVNFWLDESKDFTLEQAREYVKFFNLSKRNIRLEVNQIKGQLMFSFSFGLEDLEEHEDD